MTDLTNELFLAAHGCLPEDHPQWELQLSLEEEMRSAGIARFEKSLETSKERGTESQNMSSRRMMIHAHEKVVEGIQAFIDSASSGKAGVKHTAIAYLKDADVEVVAHIALRNLFDTVSLQLKITTVASRIAGMIEDELHFNAFRSHDEDAYDWAKKKIVAQSQNPNYRKRVMAKHARNKDVVWQEWAQDVRVKIGLKLIEIVIAQTGLFQTKRQSEGTNNTNIYVTATAETLAWLGTENSRMAPLSPVYLPTVVPPRPWSSGFKGGYWSGRVRGLRLVKTKNKAYLTDLESVEMEEVFSSVNLMQETAWAINNQVFDVMTSLWDSQSSLECLPQAEDQPLPADLPWLVQGMKREDMTEAQAEIFGRWKADRTMIYEANAKAVSKRMSFTRMMWVAERFKDIEEFYFPHQLDFRGRG